MKKELKIKEYTYNFIGGGWNTQSAKTKKQAIALAKKRWGVNHEINENSFRISSEAEMKNLLSLFW
jgi:hypothetical protein